MRQATTLHAALGLALCLMAHDALAKVYKWVDEHGQVHYSDAPQGSDNAPIAAPTTAPGTPAPSGSDQQRRLLDALTTERLEREEKQREAAAEREKREAYCAIARDRLRQYNDAGSLYELGMDGERRTLDDKERNEVEAAARADVEKWCD